MTTPTVNIAKAFPTHIESQAMLGNRDLFLSFSRFNLQHGDDNRNYTFIP